MGHSDATFEQAKRGFEAGARQATHTYNAMRGLHHREPGILGFSLVEDELDAELIYDRIHVSKPAAEVLLRCKPTHRVIGMSDGTMAAGLPTGERFKMWGLDVYTGEGEVRLVETDGPAGSAVTQLDVFRCLAEDFGLLTAIQACCINPRRVLKMPENPQVWIEMDLNLQIMQVHQV
jgi:N-acetylglucosamine-6-phosphate deacetylase